ncbi:MAG: DUF885 domain-containing protein [Lachnospiraceae bacterium]|nr:DUF885 domain-containing protein [Lachnospiraceae bacterium]
MLSSFFSRYFSASSVRRRILLPVLLGALLTGGLWFFSLSASESAVPAAARKTAENEYESYEESSLRTQSTFDAFTEKLFCEMVSANTLDLHYTLADPEIYGIEETTVTLGSESPDDLDASFDRLRETLEELQTFSSDDLTEEQQLTYDILEAYLTTSLSLEEISLYYEVLAPTTGIQVELPILLGEYAFRNLQDVEDYLALLEDVPRYFNTILEREQAKSAAGLFMCDALAESIAEDCLAFIADPDSLYLAERFEEKLTELGLSGTAREEYIARHEEILSDSVLPAYQSLADGLTDLLGTGQYDGGLCQYPEGRAYYEYLVRAGTGSSHSVEELRSLIAEQLVSDLANMSALLEKEPTLTDRFGSFSFTLTEPEAILRDLQQKTTADFPALPEADTEPVIRSVHSSLEASSSPAFYLTCPLDDLSENIIYINESSSSTSTTRLYTVLAHESYPGHLYQTVYSTSCYTTPLRAVLSFPGYSEGWATYVEQLSYGWDDSSDVDLAELVRLNSFVGLGLSALLDIEIHYNGYTVEEAYEFLSDYMTVDEATVEALYHQILGNPANYLTYYMGCLEILALRDDAKEILGESYTDKSFHQAILTIGEAPFDVLREYLPSYLE